MKLHNDQGRVVIQAACGDANGDQPVYHCLEVPRGGEFSFLLPDSTTVFLNAESRLRFPDRFVPGSERIVYLSGEAYFDVKRDPRSPFLVCLEHSAVKVTGTSFNVKAYPDDTNEATTLISGTVSMGIGTTEQWIVLKPGEQGYYDATRKTLLQQTVDVNYYTAWKDGMFRFRDVRLEEIMRVVERWYDMTVVYEDESAKASGMTDWKGDYNYKTARDSRWGYGLAGGGGISFLIRRFEINVRARYYFGLSDVVRNRNKYADNGIDGSENPFWATPMRSPLDNLTISVGLSYRFNKEGFSTWKPRPKREKNREVFKYGL